MNVKGVNFKHRIVERIHQKVKNRLGKSQLDELVGREMNRRHVLYGMLGTMDIFSGRDLSAIAVEQDEISCSTKNLDFFSPGPYRPANLKVEHTCSSCFPSCLGDQCILRMRLYYPASFMSETAASSCLERQKPWPLAILTSGFLVNSKQYHSYAEQLASYGYVAVIYDKIESLSSTIDDEVSARFISEIIDWLGSSPGFGGSVHTSDSVYVVGHSRGGKVSLLAAENDNRIGAVCLIDPVDSNTYAPEGPGYPSAISGLNKSSNTLDLPIAIIGGGKASDCIPTQSNYERFYEHTQGYSLQVAIKEAGHFQYLDDKSFMQTAICAEGDLSDEVVRGLSQAVMVAWAEVMIQQKENKVKGPLDRVNFSIESIKNKLSDNYNISSEDVQFKLKGFYTDESLRGLQI